MRSSRGDTLSLLATLITYESILHCYRIGSWLCTHMFYANINYEANTDNNCILQTNYAFIEENANSTL